MYVMAGLRKGMMGLVGLVFLLLCYNLLTNRPLRVPTDPAQVQVTKALQTKLWGAPAEEMHPCWSKPTRKGDRKEWGYVLVTCSHGPHYHRHQIANAVILAHKLGATLVMPTIRESLKEPGSNFDDIYNVKHFIATLEGVVRIMGRLPDELQGANRTTLTVPYSITKTFIEETIRPVFERSMILVLEKFVPDTKDLRKEEEEEEEDAKELEAIRCLVMHQSLLFLPQIEKLGNRLKNRMREAAQSTGGRFIAVDYRFDMLREEPCHKGIPTTLHATKLCPSPQDLGTWLQLHGFAPDTAIYLTQSRLDESLDPLLSFFPNVITKEYSMPFNEENQFLFTGKSQLELAVDFYVCARSDVFIPLISRTFYAAVAGERIKFGLLHMLEPAVKRSITTPTGYDITLTPSQVVTQGNHPVYSCFCKGGQGLEPGLQQSEREASSEITTSGL